MSSASFLLKEGGGEDEGRGGGGKQSTLCVAYINSPPQHRQGHNSTEQKTFPSQTRKPNSHHTVA